jgi:hypothetical protein
LATQPYLIVAAIIAVYIVLGILYESFIHPITILSTLPSAGVGAFLALMALGYDFSLIALIGMILLVGIVKKNAIMMIDFALVGERSRLLTPEQAIYEACLLRFRPIMMTTMAALLGGLPLALGTGPRSCAGRSASPSSATSCSRSFSLYTTPVIYIYLGKIVNLWRPAAYAAGERSSPAACGGMRAVCDLEVNFAPPFIHTVVSKEKAPSICLGPKPGGETPIPPVTSPGSDSSRPNGSNCPVTLVLNEAAVEVATTVENPPLGKLESVVVVVPVPMAELVLPKSM